MGDLLAEIEEATSRQGLKCAMRNVMETLDEDDRDKLLTAFSRWPILQDTAVARALQNRGFDIKADSVGRHRRRVTNAPGDRCQCPVSKTS
jgi:hypothetical protein